MDTFTENDNTYYEIKGSDMDNSYTSLQDPSPNPYTALDLTKGGTEHHPHLGDHTLNTDDALDVTEDETENYLPLGDRTRNTYASLDIGHQNGDQTQTNGTPNRSCVRKKIYLGLLITAISLLLIGSLVAVFISIENKTTKDIDDCSPGLCGSNGTCVDGVNSYICLCATGITGTNCETNIDDCTPGLCGSYGTCVSGVNSYTCLCAIGLTGNNCETNIDDCTPGLCGYYGTCVDGVNSYTCLCATGLTGTNCETNIDDCTPGLCGSYGTCVDGVNSYTCLCATGLTGTNCETNIDDCTPGLCGSYGTCVDGVNSYTCLCATGFTGTNCEIKLTDCFDVLKFGHMTKDGVYNVATWRTNRQIQVFCDMTTSGGGWTVFQNRYDGSVDFYRTFAEYENGFGDLQTEFWLGLKYIQEMADQGMTELRIDLQAANGTRAFETFSKFSLSNDSKYRLNIGITTSSSHILDDSFRNHHNGQAFTTKDRDLDKTSVENCAVRWHGAWWYNACHIAHLNGQYLTPGNKDWAGMVYGSFISKESLKTSKMMLRRVK